jgi:hypothetical protein
MLIDVFLVLRVVTQTSLKYRGQLKCIAPVDRLFVNPLIRLPGTIRVARMKDLSHARGNVRPAEQMTGRKLASFSGILSS